MEEIDLLPQEGFSVLEGALDDPRYNEWVEFIYTTNDLKKVPKSLVGKLEARTAQMNNPDKAERAEKISGFFKLQGFTPTAAGLDYLVKNTDGLSVRAVESIVIELFDAYPDGFDTKTAGEAITKVKKLKKDHDDATSTPMSWGSIGGWLAGGAVVIEKGYKVWKWRNGDTS